MNYSAFIILLGLSDPGTYILPILVLGGIALLLELYQRGKEDDQFALTENLEPDQSDDSIKVIFADLVGMDGHSQSDTIWNGLADEIYSGSEKLPIEIVRSPEALSLDEGGLIKLKQTAQKILVDHDADLLIWGQIVTRKESYTLSFIKNEERGGEVFSRLLCGVEKITLKNGELSVDDALTIVTLSLAHGLEICETGKKSRILGLQSLQSRLEKAVLPVKAMMEAAAGSDQVVQASRERLWVHAWWRSVIALQQGHKAKLIEASLLWVDMLTHWVKEETSYDTASARNNLAVIGFFLAQITKEQIWFTRSENLAAKAQFYFRGTGYPRRWSELEFLRLAVSSHIAIIKKDQAVIADNITSFEALQQIWLYEKHPDFWVRLDHELDTLKKHLAR